MAGPTVYDSQFDLKPINRDSAKLVLPNFKLMEPAQGPLHYPPVHPKAATMGFTALGQHRHDVQPPQCGGTKVTSFRTYTLISLDELRSSKALARFVSLRLIVFRYGMIYGPSHLILERPDRVGLTGRSALVHQPPRQVQKLGVGSPGSYQREAQG